MGKGLVAERDGVGVLVGFEGPHPSPLPRGEGTGMGKGLVAERDGVGVLVGFDVQGDVEGGGGMG